MALMRILTKKVKAKTLTQLIQKPINYGIAATDTPDYYRFKVKSLVAKMQKKSPVHILKRLIEILNIVSKSTGRRVGTQEILQKLQEKNIHVSARTIQRDLRMMQEVGFPLDVDKHSPMGAKIDKNNEWLALILKQATEQQK